MYCQAYRQLSAIPSSQFCVRLACGGDPTYSFNVKFTGEEVHGTSKFFFFQGKLGRVKQFWYLSPMRAAKVQASLRIRAVSPEPPLLAHTSSESRGTFR